MSPSPLVCRGAHDEQLFVKERNEPEAGLRNRQRDERQVEAAIEQAGNHFLRYAYGHADFRVGIALSQLSQRAPQLVDQGGDARREMERANIFRKIILKLLLDVAHQLNNFLGPLRKAQGCRSRNQPLSTPYEEFRVKFVSKVMELETNGARRQVNLFRRARHARGVHDG